MLCLAHYFFLFKMFHRLKMQTLKKILSGNDRFYDNFLFVYKLKKTIVFSLGNSQAFSN